MALYSSPNQIHLLSCRMAAQEYGNIKITLYVLPEDEEGARMACDASRFAEYYENPHKPTCRDYVVVRKPYIMECYVCGAGYLETYERVTAWAESEREYDPTDWECPACRDM